MNDVLFLTYNLADTNSFYRSAGVIKDLQKKMNCNFTAVQLNQIDDLRTFITRFDILMVQRPFTSDMLSLLAYAKECRLKTWVDWDDDLFHLNDDNPAYWTYNNPDIQEIMKRIVTIADAVSVPTEYLRQVLSGLNENIFVIPNAFNDSLFERPELPKRTNNVIWRGTATHQKDIWTYGNEIEKCMKEFSDWRFLFNGYWPWFLNKYGNSGHNEMEELVIYHKNLFKTAPACIQVPLHDNVFNRSKSNIAAIEGTYAGAVCIVPEWWNMPGTLPYIDSKSYYEALRSVLAGEVDIVAQNNICWEYINDCLLLSKVNVQRIELLDTLF